MCVHVPWLALRPEGLPSMGGGRETCLPCTHTLAYEWEGPGKRVGGWQSSDSGGVCGCLNMSVSKDRERHQGGGHPALEAVCRAGSETTGQGSGVGGAGPQQLLCTPLSFTGLLPLPLAQPSPLLRRWASLQLAWLLVPASLLCVTLGKGLHSGPQFPTHHPVTVASHQSRCCFAVARRTCGPSLLLSWAGKRAWGVHAVCPAAAPGSPGRRLPKPGSGTQCSRPRLEGRVRRGGQGGEGKRREGKEREGKGGEWEGQSGPLCVCVFVCVHTWGAHTMCHLCA